MLSAMQASLYWKATSEEEYGAPKVQGLCFFLFLVLVFWPNLCSQVFAQDFRLNSFALSVNGNAVQLTPDFDPAVKKYTAAVPWGTSTADVTVSWTKLTLSTPLTAPDTDAAADYHGACPRDVDRNPTDCRWTGPHERHEARGYLGHPNPTPGSTFFKTLVSGARVRLNTDSPCTDFSRLLEHFSP